VSKCLSGTNCRVFLLPDDRHKLRKTCAGKAQLCYNLSMTTKTLKEVIEHAATWPREDQEELAEYAREIEARRTGVYVMSDGEREAVARGLAQANRGEFVSDEMVADADKRHGL
jgi:hypothetical protein